MKFLLPLLALIYALSPYDLFPDFFVGPGWVDDLIVLFLLWWYFFIFRKRQYRQKGPSEKNQRYNSEKSEEEQAWRDDTNQAEYNSQEKEIPKTPYMVLGVEKDASMEEIKNAYRRLANKYHPDRVSHLGEEFKDLAERRFKEIQEAYQELTAS